MKRISLIGLLVGGIVMLQLVRLGRAPAAELGYDVRGQVLLVSAAATKPAGDASRVVEWLAPLDTADPVPTSLDGDYEMVQQDKRFTPDMLVVPVGSVVTFPNRDPWFHNVFSLYRGKRFDLGLYQAGDVKKVRFDRVGPSYIFCNIHPQMAAVVLTIDSKYFGLSDKDGRIAISGVPAGEYRMNIWYENADAEALRALSRDVMIDDDRPLPTVSINVVPHDLRNHKNKYGQDYDTGALAPNY